MRKNSVIAFFSLCALSLFWACGDGEFVNASNDDYLAIERYANVSADKVADIMGNCDGNQKCIEETLKNLQIVDVPDTTKKDSTKSSSSVKDSVVSSSSAVADTSAKDTSVTTDSTASSSSVADTAAVSSSSVAGDSTVTSSATAGSSATDTTATSSSSRGGRSSSSDEAESATSSSEDIEESSDSGEEELPVEGTCDANVSKVGIGGSVTWTYQPKEGSRSSGMIEWNDNIATEETYAQKGKDLFSVTMVYSDADPGDKVYPELTFDGVTISCEGAAVTITAAVASSSSKEEETVNDSSSSSAPKSSSSKATGNSSSSISIIPIGGSSSSKQSSSSAANSSSGETPASSETVTPESSAEPESSETPTSSESGEEDVPVYNVSADEFLFSIDTPMNVCFESHEVKNPSWQQTANISFGSCGEAGCSLTVGSKSATEWNGITLNVALDADKTFSGCYLVKSSNNAKLNVSVLEY